MKTTVAVFFGGCSVEHEVSIISGLQAHSALDREKYNAVPVYQAKSGIFYTGADFGSIDSYKDLPALLKKAKPACLVSENGKVVLRECGLFGRALCAPDVALPVFHGSHGEDGCFQGLLEQLCLPYAGCGVCASAVGMDKAMMKAAFAAAGVPCLPYARIDRAAYFKTPEDACAAAEEKIGYPMIVKPYNLGSSVGIGKAHDRASLSEALADAFRYTESALCEHCITELREINCAVLGNAESAVPSVCEEPHGGADFLSYADKYQSGAKNAKGMTSLSRSVPAELSPEMTEKVQDCAVRAFHAIGAEGAARVDLMIDKTSGELFVNEINTIPGSLSFYLWEYSGISFPELLDRLIELAFARARRRAELASSFDTNLLQTAHLGGAKK